VVVVVANQRAPRDWIGRAEDVSLVRVLRRVVRGRTNGREDCDDSQAMREKRSAGARRMGTRDGPFGDLPRTAGFTMFSRAEVLGEGGSKQDGRCPRLARSSPMSRTIGTIIARMFHRFVFHARTRPFVKLLRANGDRRKSSLVRAKTDE
jgi:hypothetical protein